MRSKSDWIRLGAICGLVGCADGAATSSPGYDPLQSGTGAQEQTGSGAVGGMLMGGGIGASPGIGATTGGGAAPPGVGSAPATAGAPGMSGAPAVGGAGAVLNTGGDAATGGDPGVGGGGMTGFPEGAGGLDPVNTGGVSINTGGSGAGGSGAGGSGAGGSGAGGSGAGGSGAGGSGAEGSGASGSGAGGATPTGPSTEDTSCCPTAGNCLCHGPDPTGLTGRDGPFRTATIQGTTGTIYYPTGAEPPFAGIAICPGFLNSGPEMRPWGEFYASWGIVTNVTHTLGSDIPAIRAIKLIAAVDEMKAQDASGPLAGNMAGRYGTSGYSMGGGGTTLASAQQPTYLTSVGLAAWGPDGTDLKVPTLFLCGSADVVAPCLMSAGAYSVIPESTPKMLATVPGASHFQWFSPSETSGGAALAFQKVFLEGDERWKPLLLQVNSDQTNIN